MDFYAYYPYIEDLTNARSIVFSVKTDQSNEADYWASDFLWGKRTDVSPTTDAVSIEMKHLFSNILIYLVAGEGISEEELAAADVDIKICNVWRSAYISTATGNINDYSTNCDIKPWNTGEYYRAILPPQKVSGSKKLLSVKINGKEYSYYTDVELKSNTKHKITVKFNATEKDNVVFSIKEWEEDGVDYGGNLRTPSVDEIPRTLVTNATMGSLIHSDFGYPSILAASDNYIGEITSNYSYVYNHFYYYSSQLHIGPNGICIIIWDNYYKFISVTNSVIKEIASSKIHAKQRAIAKTYRALFYLDLARFYDPLYAVSTELPSYQSSLAAVEGLTVPYVDENTTEEMEKNNPRLPREELFQLIFNDLNEAENSLYEYTPATKDMPSLAVVYGLKARAYLWLGGFNEGLYNNEKYPDVVTGRAAYTKAAEYARKAIDYSSCTPLSEDLYCSKTNGFNDASHWMWGLSQTSETLISSLHNWAGHMCIENLSGYGQFTHLGVRKATYERMSDTDFRKKLIVGPNTTYDNYKLVTNLTESEWNEFGSSEGVQTYTHFKFRTKDGKKDDWKNDCVVDIPMMRIEEMYFIEAEAKEHISPGSGKRLITAFMTSHRDPNYSIPAGADVIEEIIFQKRCEFWGEGILFFDFKRLDMGIDNAYEGSNSNEECRFSTTGRCPAWNFCIPTSAIQQNIALEGKNNPDPTNTLKSKF